MPSTIPINVLTSLLLLIVFCISFEVYAMRNKDVSRLWVKAATGVWLGCISIALMHFNIQLGVVAFDFRTVVLCLTGLFFGTVPTVAALTTTVGYILIHSAGSMPTASMIAECTYTIASGISGALFHDDRRKWVKFKSISIIATTILIAQVIMALCIHFAGSDESESFTKDHAIVIFAVIPATASLIGMMITARITHFDTERQLKLLEDKYNKLILCNDDIFWEIEHSGKISYVSDNVTQAIGYQPKELVGHMPYYIIDDVESVRLITEYDKNNEKPGHNYFRNLLVLKHKKGNKVYFDTRVMSIIDPSINKTTGFVCVTRNVTNAHLHNELSKHNQKFIREQTSRLHGLQKELAEYKKQLELANQATEEARKQSSKNISQQLTTISNICNEMVSNMEDIRKYTAILRDKSASDSSKDTALEQLVHSSEFLNSLTKDLIDSDALSKGITKIKLSIGNIEKIINEVCDYHNTRNLYLLKKPIILQREIDLRHDQKTVKTDVHLLKRILNILIANAYVFTNTGQITVKCSLRSDTELLFCVSDTGIGVPEGAYKNMFKPVNETEIPPHVKKTTVKYSVLGLSICKSLVELMGGKIWFVSGIGKGTTINFYVPYIKAGEIASEENAQYTWQGHTALVATNNRFTGILVSETLAKTKIKYRSIHIGDENEPLDSEYFKNYDIIITDNETSATPTMQTITQKYPAAAVIIFDEHTTATAIRKEIDKKLTEKHEI
ncbi:MAG: PAS domain S-box protein [Bacteroidales bacterium]|nr:PAS domain S-box protein [Bacteroidales bacterium]